MGRFSRGLKHMWNAFSYEEQQRVQKPLGTMGVSYGGSSRPQSVRVRVSNERSIVSSIYSRLAVDVASAEFKHCRQDDDGKFLEVMDSGLQDCLSVEANLDQTPDHLLRDLILTACDKGVAAVVPIETDVDPNASGSWDVKSWRVGEIVQWYPRSVRVEVYDDRPEKGIRQQITLPKSQVAIVENPFYTIMNEPNSTFQRLIHKLSLLDAVDEQSASGKLDMIIQLPYVIKSEARRQQADQRRKDIEFQLKGSQYGIAYTDGTEKVTQLNRPAENNLLTQIEYLMKVLYGQLGLTEEVMNGTADEKTMLNYWNRTIEPILNAICEGMRRNFLTKTARTQLQWILFFRDPFRLVPIENIAEIADKFTRNEIATSNEIRQVVGWKPSKEKKADKLINSNMPVGDTGVKTGTVAPPPQTDPKTQALIDQARVNGNGSGAANTN